MAGDKKAIEQQIVQDITNSYQTKKFIDELGNQARIERETIENDQLATALKEVLEDIGRDIQNVGREIPKGMEYVGSAAVHIYRAPVTGMIAYYNQLALGNCPEALAGPAVSDLRNAMLINYGHKPQRKRSGF